MTTDMATKRLTRYTHKIFVSLNLGFILKLAMSEQPGFTWELTMWPKFNGYLQLHPHDPRGYWIGFFAVALVLSLIIFALLQTFLHIFNWGQAILSAAGISSLFALPILCLYQNYYKSPVPTLPHPPGVLLIIELAATLAYSVSYLFKRARGTRSMVLVILIHFLFWAWLFLGGVYFWRAPAQSVFPTVGLCSALAWALYVHGEQRTSGVGGQAISMNFSGS
jgi:hypothetical protein